MQSKKIILFIVEGIHDKTSLSICLSDLLEGASVHFVLTNGDITSRYGTSPKNISERIGAIIKKFSGSIFKPKDFFEVVHIIDTDGAFVSEEHIKKVAKVEEGSPHTKYKPEEILTPDPMNIKERNDQKSDVIERMLSIEKVWRTIPYHVYYFSSNMDHVLHNNPNLTREEKEQMAEEFENQYYKKPKEFIKIFQKNDLAVQGNYEETWDFIKLDCNSLKRYSNFGIYLEERKSKTR